MPFPIALAAMAVVGVGGLLLASSNKSSTTNSNGKGYTFDANIDPTVAKMVTELLNKPPGINGSYGPQDLAKLLHRTSDDISARYPIAAAMLEARARALEVMGGKAVNPVPTPPMNKGSR